MKTGITITDVKYYINKEKKTVVCTITANGLTFKGKAKCSSNDTFDDIKGRRISESKAKRRLFTKAAQEYEKRAKSYHKQYELDNIRAKFCYNLADREWEHVIKLSSE